MKLTLRDLFWLILVVATGCAWWADRERFQQRERELQESHREAAARVEAKFRKMGEMFMRMTENREERELPTEQVCTRP